MPISTNDPASIQAKHAVMLVFACSVILGVAALSLTLSGAPIALARVNTRQNVLLDSVHHGLAACQAGEVLPRGTSALRLQMFSFIGPRVAVAVFAHGRLIARGERGSGWTGGSVTVPVGALPATRSAVTLCFALYLNGDEFIQINGEATRAALAAHGRGVSLPGRVGVEDLRPGDASWWSLLVPVARRMGLGHAWSGTWCVLLVLALMLGVTAISALVGLRELT